MAGPIFLQPREQGDFPELDSKRAGFENRKLREVLDEALKTIRVSADLLKRKKLTGSPLLGGALHLEESHSVDDPHQGRSKFVREETEKVFLERLGGGIQDFR